MPARIRTIPSLLLFGISMDSFLETCGVVIDGWGFVLKEADKQLLFRSVQSAESAVCAGKLFHHES